MDRKLTMQNEALEPQDDDLPMWLREVIARLPAYIDDKRGAQVVSEHLFEISHRTVEIWPLPTRHINGRAMHPTVAVLREAWRRVNAEPEVVRSVRPVPARVGRGRYRRTQTAEAAPAPT